MILSSPAYLLSSLTLSMLSLKNYRKPPEYAMVYLHPIPFHMLLPWFTSTCNLRLSPCGVSFWEVRVTYLSRMQHSPVQFSHLVMSDSLRPHEPQHARPLCPSLTAGVYPNPCPLSRWCHPTISSSVIPFSSCLQSFPGSGSFPMSQLFASVLECQLQHQSFQEHPGLICLRMDWLDLRAVQGTLKSLLQHHSSKASILRCSAFFIVQL